MESQPPLFSFLSPSLHSRGGWSGVSIRQDGHLEAAEPVPFRLTRNLQSFFTAYGIEGLFIASLGATAQALTGAHSPLEHHLTLFFRDELMTHQFRPQRPGPEVCVNRTQVCVLRFCESRPVQLAASHLVRAEASVSCRGRGRSAVQNDRI
jgi:hypothetical protein